MYSDKYDETIVEGDEKEATNIYDDETIFEMDDLPSQHNQHHSPEIKVRYYTPTNEEPHGLSQSVIVNDHDYMVSNILHMRLSSHYNQETISDKENSLHMIPTSHTTIYSRSAPPVSFLSDSPNIFSCYTTTKDDCQTDNNTCAVGSSGSSINTVTPFNFRGTNGDTFVSLPTQTPPFEASNDSQETTTEEVNTIVSPTASSALEQPTAILSQNNNYALQESIIELNAYLTLQYNPSDLQSIYEVDTVPSLPHIEADLQERYEHRLTLVPQNTSIVTDPALNNLQHTIRPPRLYENSSAAWNTLATEYFRADSYLEYPDNTVYSDSNQQWENMHCGTENLKKITGNPFVFENIVRHEFSIKVTGLDSSSVNYRDIIDHFHDPNVVVGKYKSMAMIK